MQREINRSFWPTLWCCREMAALMKGSICFRCQK
jgi:hypothetical protein